MRDLARVVISAVLIGAIAAGRAPAQEAAGDCRVTDIVLEASNGGFWLVLYGPNRKACAATGTATFYKKAIKFKDMPRMEGRGINQQIAMERVEYEEYEPVAKVTFSGSDFRRVKIGAGEGIPALPVRLPGIARGDWLRIEYDGIRKDAVVGW